MTLRSVTACVKLILFAAWSLLLVPFQILVYGCVPRAHPALRVLPRMWHRGVCAILGLRVRLHGQRSPHAGTLFVVNHLSYLDIPVLGSALGSAFVSKADVKHWPLFGFLSQLNATVYVSRARNRSALNDESATLAARLKQGCDLVLFPEGTNTLGDRILPFKSTFFSTLEEIPDSQIQPITLIVRHIDGRPLTTLHDFSLYGWPEDKTMPPHLWRFAHTSGAVIDLVFHPVIKAHGQDRKALSNMAEHAVRSAFPLTPMAKDTP